MFIKSKASELIESIYYKLFFSFTLIFFDNQSVLLNIKTVNVFSVHATICPMIQFNKDIL